MALLRPLLLLCAALFALATFACKPTVENQTAAWSSNRKAVDQLMAQYPGFKPALQSRLASADTLKAKADGLEGEAAAEQLQSANRTLMAGFVGELKGLDGKLAKLRKRSVEAMGKAGDPSSRMAAKTAADDVTKTIARVEAALKTGASDDKAADAVLAKVAADIKTAGATLDTALKTDKAKKDGKAADKKSADSKAADAKAAEQAKVADWKCQYCASMNKHDHTKCESCGAPRAGDKKKAGAK